MLFPIVIGLTLLFSAYLFSSYWRLHHIPGPFLASFSKLWLLKWVIRAELHIGLLEACEKYGHIARIGPNEVVTNDPEIIRRINAVRSPYKRSTWYNSTCFDHSRNHVFCERDEGRHVELRNQMIAGYSGKENPSLELSIDKRLTHFISFIRQKYLSCSVEASSLEKREFQSASYCYKPVDFARIAQYFALDVISDIAFGQPFGFLETDSDVHDYIKTQKALLPLFEWFAMFPSLWRLTRIGWVSRLLMPKTTDKSGLGCLMGVAERIVNHRYAATSKCAPKSDMLGSFIRHGLPQEQAKVETVLQVMAGSDTTVTSLRMFVLFMNTSPPVLHRLLAELDAAEKAGKLSRPMARGSEIQAHIPYLCACVKESLRMWPPVLGLGFKDVPEGGDTINDIFLPAGTSVGCDAWGLHRSKAVYGDDADFYRPGRWIDTKDEKKLAEMNRSADLVFGYGKNGCLGKPVAFMELNKTVTELFRRFDISLVKPWEPIRSVQRNGLFVQSDMWVRISQREGVDEF
ncbi:hypothetical protein GJ744_002985 [Endocarpon pusillum]|uniref:Pisatin demethylase n=1 Tax=Endocarpon pusillum TaxID=364733 RepID=A0A8H7AEW6_9EURO|nr:hypothetical protein GJ744_002985 [Endocarpon pusillum]